MKKGSVKVIELQQVDKERFGRVDTHDVRLYAHEYDMIYFLSKYGFDIEVIKPTNCPKTTSPDIQINGAIWEMKSPEGAGTSTIGRQFHRAGKQADKLVLDLRRIKIPAEKAEADALNRFRNSTSIKRLFLITKDARLLDVKH